MILGLDLGQSIGWCRGRAVGPMEFGTHLMPNTTDLGQWLAGADPFFRTVMPGVTGIAVEQPFLGSDYYPARKLLAQLGQVWKWANLYGLGKSCIQEIAVPTAKYTLAGHGRAEKYQMIEAAAKLGFEDLDEHQADALAIWWVMMHGAREHPAPARSRSGKGKSIMRTGA